MTVIDTATNTNIGAPISVGTMSSAIAVSPDGGHVYVCNFGENTVSVIDTATNSVVRSALTGGECMSPVPAATACR